MVVGGGRAGGSLTTFDRTARSRAWEEADPMQVTCAFMNNNILCMITLCFHFPLYFAIGSKNIVNACQSDWDVLRSIFCLWSWSRDVCRLPVPLPTCLPACLRAPLALTWRTLFLHLLNFPLLKLYKNAVGEVTFLQLYIKFNSALQLKYISFKLLY